MKKNISICTMLIASATLFTLSCGKYYSSAPLPDKSGLGKLFADIKPVSQSFTVTAGVPSTIKGANGTGISFYANSFKDAFGNIIKNGTVDIQMTEMTSTGDMIANRASTMSGGQLLHSGGQIMINASMKGQQVFANKYGISFLQQSGSSDRMNLFYGNNNNSDSVTTWDNGGDTLKEGSVAWGTTSGSGGDMYIFDSCEHFGYANCDWFYQTDSPKTSVSVVVPDNSFDPSNTQLYLVLPDVKGVMTNAEGHYGSSGYNSKTNTINLISEEHVNIVPAGTNYKMVVIAKKKDTYYYYQTSGVVSRDLKLNAKFDVKSSSQVKALLKAL